MSFKNISSRKLSSYIFVFRIAGELGSINPHWDDETIFQEARHIVAAVTQHITYNEFLPMVLGKELMFQHELELLKVKICKSVSER